MKTSRTNSSSQLVLDDPALLFKMVFNQQFQFMAILSVEGNVLEVNELALTSQGVNREDYIGKPFWQSPAWQNFPEWENIWKARLEEALNKRGTIITEDIFQIDDGSVRYADAATTAIFEPNTGKLCGYVVQAVDTTNRRLNEQLTKENEARLVFVLEHSRIGDWELNLVDHSSHRSKMHDQIFGYNTPLKSWSYERFLEHVLVEDKAEVNRKFQHAIANQNDWNFECRIMRKDGEIRWILASGGHAFDSVGVANRMAGIVQDITEIKHAEMNELRHNAELQSIFRALPDLYFRMEADGTVLDYHTQNESELYLNPKEFLGKRMQDVLPSHIGKMFQAKIVEIANSDKALAFKYELPLKQKVKHFDARLNKIAMNNQLICVIRDVTEQEHLYKCLEQAQKQAKVGSWEQIFEQAEVKHHWSNEACSILEYDSNELIHYKHFVDRVHPDDRSRISASFDLSIELCNPYYAEYRLRFSDGRIKHIVEHAEHFFNDNGVHIRTVGTFQDISERKQAEEKLQLSSKVFSNTHEGIIITNQDEIVIDVNPAFCEITGYSRDEIIGKNPRVLSSGKQNPDFYREMWQCINEHGYWQGEIWNRKKSGEIYAELLTISLLEDDNGNAVNYVGVFTDITHSKKQQEQLSRIAHYDLLTNLPNRALLADRLSQAMLQCKRNDQLLAVVFLDLDGFKLVNDNHGHDVGDKLLVEISLRMKKALREGDSLARIGGDEFVAVLTDLNALEDCEPILERLLLSASDQVAVGDVLLHVSASIGLTLYPQDNVDADLLMRHADQAMYVAKESGKNCYHLFDIAQDDAIKRQRESLEAIRTAIDTQQFLLLYQPKVNMKTGEVIGVEALIRWQHPELGLLNPADFLPMIENNPMSIELGEWVIESVLKQISIWQKMGLKLSVSTSVNIAAVQLQQPNFTQRLKAILSKFPEVKPHYLELEVLETSALGDVQHVSKLMEECIALGVNFALDDFGTGYSSLTYLRRLPASLIKIDQSFVNDMLHNSEDLAIVEGVIALAKSFKRDVIAEGVETVEHGTVLLNLGCELAQGFGIAKPMKACDVANWINNWQPDKQWRS